MSLFRFLKGALIKMTKAFVPKRVPRKNVLEKRKYNMSDISRTQIKLPPNHSALSITKYFEDSESLHAHKKNKDLDW